MIVICSVCEGQIRKSNESMGIVVTEVCPKCADPKPYTVVTKSDCGHFEIHRMVSTGRYVLMGPDDSNAQGVTITQLESVCRMIGSWLDGGGN